MPPDPNAPWNPSNDPMDIYGKNRAGAWPITPLNPSQPAPNPFATAPGHWGPGVSLGEAVTRVGHAAGGDFLINLLVVGVLWDVWVCLYPLAALAGAFTFYYAFPFVLRLIPRPLLTASPLSLTLVGLAAAAVVLWMVSRFEHVLAGNGVYRLARHFVRLPLVGLAVILLIERTHGIRYTVALHVVSRILSIPQYFAMVIGSMVVAHFALWNWRWGREFWHERLRGAQLRKRGT